MATEIIYNGSVIASLDGGETATLACVGKVMESNVVVTAAADSGDSAGVETCSVSFDLETGYTPIKIHYTNGDMANAVHTVNSRYYTGVLTCAKGTGVFIGAGIPSNEAQYMKVSGNIEMPYNNWPLLLVNGDGSVDYAF